MDARTFSHAFSILGEQMLCPYTVLSVRLRGDFRPTEPYRLAPTGGSLEGSFSDYFSSSSLLRFYYNRKKTICQEAAENFGRISGKAVANFQKLCYTYKRMSLCGLSRIQTFRTVVLCKKQPRPFRLTSKKSIFICIPVFPTAQTRSKPCLQR